MNAPEGYYTTSTDMSGSGCRVSCICIRFRGNPRSFSLICLPRSCGQIDKKISHSTGPHSPGPSGPPPDKMSGVETACIRLLILYSSLRCGSPGFDVLHLSLARGRARGVPTAHPTDKLVSCVRPPRKAAMRRRHGSRCTFTAFTVSCSRAPAPTCNERHHTTPHHTIQMTARAGTRLDPYYCVLSCEQSPSAHHLTPAA